MNMDFKREMMETFGKRILDISLRGSHSRGEARDDSDIDYFIFLDEIKDEDMPVIERIAKKHSVQPLLLDKGEFERLTHVARFQFFMENRSIFERLEVPFPTAEDGWELIKRNFEEALHATRHYLFESHDASRIVRAMHYWIKSIDFSLRAYMLLKTNMYPNTRKALRSFAQDMPEALWILDTLDTWEEKKDAYREDARAFLFVLDANLRRLLPRVLP